MRNGEFFLTPVIAAALFGAAPRVAWFVCGAVLWTFAEYAVRRALHVFHARMHFHHHAHPKEPPNPLFAPFWLALVVLVSFAPWAFVSGFVAGYSWFIHVHNACHFDREAVAPSLLQHHDKHHHAHPNFNFGVSFRFWDVVLRTAR